MARPSLFTHRKLPRLARLAQVTVAEALGLLEFLWHAQYEVCSEVIGDSIDVETLARWEGEPERLTSALVGSGFVDDLGDGRYAVHDFWDHAPDYVRKRAEREAARKDRGVTLSEVRAESGRRGAQATNAGRSRPGNALANGRTDAGHDAANVRQVAGTPAPAPAPAPKGIPPEAPPAGGADADEGFEEFWHGYPRKAKKPAARKAWGKLSIEDRNAARDACWVIADVWRGASGDELVYCPHPATWLNGRGWEDGRDEAERLRRRDTARSAPRALVGAHSPKPRPRPAPATEAASLPPPPPGGGVWPRVLAALRPRVDERDFDTWFRGTRQVGELNGALRVAVSGPLFLEYIPREYGAELEEALKACGVSVPVEYLTDEAGGEA